jgi:hypothetical protein
MVALPVIAGIHRVAFQWRAAATGPFAVNVMHFYNPASDPDGLKTALDTNVTANMWVGASTATVIYQIAITPLDGTSATRLYTVTGTKWAGPSTPGDMIPAASIVVSLKTLERGRRRRGRIYLPFPIEGLCSNGVYTASLTTNQAAWDTFRSAMKTANWPLHVVSYGHSLHRTKTPGGGYALTPVTWTPDSRECVSSTVESTLGTIRRRQSRLRV